MPLDRELSADEFRESFRAERMLAELDVHEDLAVLHDEQSSEGIRRTLMTRYRRVLGIHPSERERLKELLAIIEQNGQPSVDSVLQTLNGSLSVGAAGGGGS